MTTIAHVLEAVEQDIAAHQSTLHLAETARDYLHALLNGGGAAIQASSPLTAALLEYVQTHPGVKRPEVVKVAVTTVPTKSHDPKKNVQTRLGQLITRRRLVDRGGRLYPV